MNLGKDMVKNAIIEGLMRQDKAEAKFSISYLVSQG